MDMIICHHKRVHSCVLSFFFSVPDGEEIEMNRKKRIVSLVLAFVMLFSCIGASAASSQNAAKLSLTLSVYKTMPLNITVNKGKTAKIKHVVKTQFRYTGLDSFDSVEKFVDRFSGSTISVTGVKWVSSNKKVATVDSKGKIKAVKKGTAYIYPVPKGVTSYKKLGYGIIYMKGAIQHGIRLYGGIGTKVKVR